MKIMATILEQERITAHGKLDMGKVLVDAELINSYDEGSCVEGLLKPDQVRSAKVTALVDTGSRLLSIPEDVIKKLGLKLFRESISKFANGQKAVRKIYGPVTIKVVGRIDAVLAMAGNPGLPPLL